MGPAFPRRSLLLVCARAVEPRWPRCRPHAAPGVSRLPPAARQRPGDARSGPHQRHLQPLASPSRSSTGSSQFDQTLDDHARRWPQFWKASRDGLTWTFTLRKGVKFHHGREVTADDVVFSLTPPPRSPRSKSAAADLFTIIKGAARVPRGPGDAVTGLTALDRYTVQIVLTEAPAPFVSVLAVGHAKIVPRELVERAGRRLRARSRSAPGPFRFVRWERGKEIVLAANPDYFDGAARGLARIVYRIFPGEQRRRDVRGVPARAPGGHARAPMQDYRADRRRRAGTLREAADVQPCGSTGFNTRVKPLDDRRVRQAIVLRARSGAHRRRASSPAASPWPAASCRRARSASTRSCRATATTPARARDLLAARRLSGRPRAAAHRRSGRACKRPHRARARARHA